MRVYTVGHSSREPAEFVRLLAEAGVTRVVDIRTVPRSRFNPWTAIDQLPAILEAHGLGYAHLPALGGLRKPLPDSPNAGWRNTSFRGYADHMRSSEFRRGLDELLAMAEEDVVTVMCAEAVPWRCHRSLVADALLARGVEVLHILDGGARPAKMTPFAKVRGGEVTYPPVGGVQMRL